MNSYGLSIDFDFWLEVPAFENLDMSHKEAPFFINELWAIRAASALSTGKDLREILKLANDEPEPVMMHRIMAKNKLTVKRDQVAVGESHIHAFEWLRDCTDITSIDAHHDLGYGISKLNCDNWLFELARLGRLKNITLIYPKWRLRNYIEWDVDAQLRADKLKEFGVNIEVHYGLVENLPSSIKFNKMFVCRSGAWVPPWLDTQFIDLVSVLMCGNGHRKWMLHDYKSLDDMVRKIDWNDIAATGEKWQQDIAKLRTK